MKAAFIALTGASLLMAACSEDPYVNRGTAIGAGVGGVAGAVVGNNTGLGTAGGAAIGAVAGGAAGNAAGAAVNPAQEDAYWRGAYTGEPYYSPMMSYDDYAPAYRLGYTGRGRYNRSFDEAENDLSRDWESTRGSSRLSWPEARHAARAAWHRVERAIPGDADGDGR
jgi:hypothetical protein